MISNFKFNFGHGLMLFSSMLVLAACSGKSDQANAAQRAYPEVSVIEARTTNMDINDTLTGRLEPVRKAEVRARTPGVLKKIYFTEGSYVKQGSPLFLIDDAPARAQVAQAQAQYTQAASQFNKISPLLKSGAISKAEYDNALTNMQAAKAALDTAKVGLDYAHVRAPISGKIGKSYETEGALVGQGQPTLLAVIQQENPLKIDINQSVNDYMKLKEYAKETQSNIQGLPFTVALNDGSEYTEEGRILFADASVDETTGQVTIKGQLPNSEGLLLPGLFVTVKIKVGSIPNVFAIPIEAVSPTEVGGTVTVVNKDGSYEKRAINIVNQDIKYIYSTDGLKVGDLVILDGAMKLMTMPEKVTYKIVTGDGTGTNTSK